MDEKMYAFDFKESDHEELREIVGGVKAKVILSYNDSNAVRSLYKVFKISATEKVHYSMNNKRPAARKKGELIIKNF